MRSPGTNNGIYARYMYTLDCIEGRHILLGISLGCSRGLTVRCICTLRVGTRPTLNEEVYDIKTYRLRQGAIHTVCGSRSLFPSSTRCGDELGECTTFALFSSWYLLGYNKVRSTISSQLSIAGLQLRVY